MADVVAAQAGTVDVEALERALADLWQDPSSDAPLAQVIRARMANLIVSTVSSAGAREVEAEFEDLVEQHPARLIELELDRSAAASPSLDAAVAAVCYPGAGGSRICSEQVKVRAGGDAVRRVASLVRQLLVGDLPTALWWNASAPPERGDELFAELRQVAQHIVVDSGAWTADEGTLRRLVDWPAAAPDDAISDLAWARLWPWRSLLAQGMSPASTPGAVESIREVVVEHAPRGLSEAGLLLGWLTSALDWQPASRLSRSGDARHALCESERGPLRLEMRQSADAIGHIAEVRVAWGAGDAASSLAILAVEGRRLALKPGTAAPRVIARPEQSRGALVARELARAGTDPQLCAALDGLRALLDRPAA